MTPVVRFLLTANVAAFFVQMALPHIANAMVFVPQLALVRPWSVVTYMFLHGGLMHLGFNMLTLFFFGPQVEIRLGARRFAILYFIGGISGALVSLIFSSGSPIIGASAGVFAVSLAFAYFWPTAQILIWGILPVQARVLVIFTTIMAIYSGFGGANDGVAHFAHLGGYAGAFIYLRLLDRKRHAFKRRATTAPAAVTARVGAWDAVDLSAIHEANRPEVSRIIEKIRSSGVGSLTYQEQIFLSSFIPPDTHPGKAG